MPELKPCPFCGDPRWDEASDYPREIEDSVECPHWIPVSERLPEGSWVLACWHHAIEVAALIGDGKWIEWNTGRVLSAPTHWQPLPDPPEVSDA